MRFFAGLRFVAWGHVPRCKALIDRPLAFPALNYAHSGRIVWSYGDGKPTILNAPVAWWTWPEEKFVYGNLQDEPWNHYYVVFDGPRVKRFFSDGLIEGKPQSAYAFIDRADEFEAKWKELFAMIALAHTAEGVHALEGLFLTLHRPPVLALQTDLEQIAHGLATRIRQMPAQNWNFFEEARKASVTLSHFRRVFRQTHGVPPHAYLLQTRIAQAARLLRTTALPVKGIAQESGFDDLFYFSKLFKKHQGLSPAVYRKQVMAFSSELSPKNGG